MISFLLFVFAFYQDTVPFKPFEEFELKLEYEFQKKPAPNATEILVNDANGGHTKIINASPLPYLIMNLKILKASDQEVRLKVIKSDKPFATKRGIESGSEIKVDLGFTDDMKDRVSAYEYTFYFLDSKKNETSKIVIFVGEDGSFFVNGEKRGKF